jgi:hypothetical protein
MARTASRASALKLQQDTADVVAEAIDARAEQSDLDARLTASDHTVIDRETGEVLDATNAPVMNRAGIASPMMAASAIEEIAQRELEDEASVAAHVVRLTGGVPVAEFEKALHTVASFLSLPVKGEDTRTGETHIWDLGKWEIKDVLNGICFQFVRLLDPKNKYGTVARLQEARDTLTEDQQALSDGFEISDQ